MDWSNVMFLNLEVEENLIRTHIPEDFEIRTYNSKAYITLVFFNLESPGLKSLNVPISFSEFNIRTYVRYKTYQGIYFLTLDVKNKLIPMCVNNIFKLNYNNTFLSYETKNYSKNAVWVNRKYYIDNFYIETIESVNNVTLKNVKIKFKKTYLPNYAEENLLIPGNPDKVLKILRDYLVEYSEKDLK